MEYLVTLFAPLAFVVVSALAYHLLAEIVLWLGRLIRRAFTI